MCHSQSETMKLTISGCQKLAAEMYLNWPNQEAAELKLDFCKYFNIKVDAELWYDNNPDKVIANDKVKVLWDFQITTDRHIPCNKPDIRFEDDIDECLVIDVAIASDLSNQKKATKKMSKYVDLQMECQNCRSRKLKLSQS